jgi:hypothetical protein
MYFGMKLYMFRTVPLSIISSYSLYTQQWYMSYRFVGYFEFTVSAIRKHCTVTLRFSHLVKASTAK